MKKCRVCKHTKDYESFEKSKSCKDGYRGTCKKCRSYRKKIHKNACQTCQKKFSSNRKNTKYCSVKCAGIAKRSRVTVSCAQCGNSKEVVKSLANKNQRHYCNQRCRTEHLKELMAEEGNPNYERVSYRCGGCNDEIQAIPSKLQTQKYVFCSNECYRNNVGRHFTGAKNNNWNHTLSDDERNDLRRYPEYYEWRIDVYARDNFTCQACGDDTGGNLIAHHIYNYSEHKNLQTEITNGITFCVDCHIRFHKLYGYTNNNKKQLQNFLK